MSELWALPVIENALLVLVEYPEPEGIVGPVAEAVGGEAAARLKRLMAEDLLRAAMQLDGCTTYVFFDPAEREDDVLDWLDPLDGGLVMAAQMPGGTGARMHAAFRRIFARNATGRAVLVMAGHPAMDARFLRGALDSLDAADVVAASSSSGGVCLLGMSRMHDALLTDVDWDARGAVDAAVGRCGAMGLRVARLPEQRGAATPDDLDALMPGWRSRV